MNVVHLDHPIVLIHGWTDNPASTGTFKVVARRVGGGIKFDAPHLSPLGSVKERADRLVGYISSQKWCEPGQRLHLIGHSMGGLVAREVAGRSGLPFTVITVTTLGTPNKGLKYLDSLPTLRGDSTKAEILRFFLGTDCGGIFNMSAKAMDIFNQETPNNPHVRYFSWAGEVGKVPSVMYAAYSYFVGKHYPKNDGLVGVDTAQWDTEVLGPGTHLGTVVGCDHETIVCTDIIKRTLPHLQAAEQNKDAPINKLSRNVFRELHRRVAGTTPKVVEDRLMAFEDKFKGRRSLRTGLKDAAQHCEETS